MNHTPGTEDADVALPSPKTWPWVEDQGVRIIHKLAKILTTRPRRGRKTPHIENPLRYCYVHLGRRPLAGYHLFLAFVAALLTLGTNVANAQMNELALSATSSASIEDKASFTSNIGRYTTSIQEDPTSIVLAAALEETSGYYSLPVITTTNITPEEPAAVAAPRTKSIAYTVQIGDTLSSIGWEYGLKVATIQYQNKLTSESIKPGQKLTLPPGDISPAIIAKAKAAEVAANNKKLLASSASSRTTTSRERASGYNGDDSGGGFVKPINWQYISRRLQSGHTGIDMVAPVGTPVVATKRGKVVDVSYGWSGGYGIMVLIDHGSGVKTRYAHLSSVAVSAGEIVDAGQLIARSGNTGRSTGAHLHFEAISGGRYLSPF